MSIRKSDRIISVEHVSKYFGEKAVLNDVNLQVRKGEFVTILGPSGCGKTTLLRLIAGFQTASEGVITMSGKEITQTPPHKRPVNTVFQKYALFPPKCILKLNNTIEYEVFTQHIMPDNRFVSHCLFPKKKPSNI
jgi:spermidine/putrescine transport system ATP-binding protein